MSDLVEIGAIASCMAVGASDPCEKACDGCRRHILVAFQAIESSGHRIVPVDPTPEMMEAYWDEQCGDETASSLEVWAAMLAAAPKVPA